MSVNNFFYQLYFFLTYLTGFGQTSPLEKVSTLPKELRECSGIVWIQPNKLAMINDSGNDAEIYFLDSVGNLISKQKLPLLENVDWEELTTDGKGNLYIGDFGNNKNERRDLKIYKLPIDNLTAKPEIISFSYADQKAFPPKKELMNYDMEAMVHIGDSLYLFSKNRTQPFTGWTYCYRLPDEEGEHIAQKLDSFQLGKGLMPSYQVTSASFEENSKSLYLLGYDKLWVFYHYPQNHFFKGNAQTYYWNSISQKEGLEIKNGKLWVTDEKNAKNGGNLYSASLPQLNEYSIKIQSREVENTLLFNINLERAGSIYWEIYSTEGTKVKYDVIKDRELEVTVEIDVSDLQYGGYILNIVVDEEPNAYKFTKPKILIEEKH